MNIPILMFSDLETHAVRALLFTTKMPHPVSRNSTSVHLDRKLALSSQVNTSLSKQKQYICYSFPTNLPHAEGTLESQEHVVDQHHAILLDKQQILHDAPAHLHDAAAAPLKGHSQSR